MENPFKGTLLGALLNICLTTNGFAIPLLGITSTPYLDLLAELVKNLVFITIGVINLLLVFLINYEKIKGGRKKVTQDIKNLFKKL